MMLTRRSTRISTRWIWFASVASCCLGACGTLAPERAGRVLNIRPVSLLVSSDIEGFELSDGSQTETVDGTGSWIPSIDGGVRFNARACYIDLTGGLGVIANGAFSGLYAVFPDAAFRFKLGEHATIGPHIGMLSLSDASWHGDADVTLGGRVGFILGVGFTVGGSRAAFSANIDYLSAGYDVDSWTNWTASDDYLDISGVALRLAVQL